MAHPPGVGYNAQEASRGAPPPAAATGTAVPSPSSTAAAATSPSGTAAAATSLDWSLPTLSSIPGGSTGEKALVVAGILLLGLFFYSRVSGNPIALGLAGPSAGSPSPLNPNTVGGAAPAPASMAQRIAAVNPGKAA